MGVVADDDLYVLVPVSTSTSLSAPGTVVHSRGRPSDSNRVGRSPDTEPRRYRETFVGPKSMKTDTVARDHFPSKFYFLLVFYISSTGFQK